MELLKLPEVMKQTTLGKSTIYAYVRNGKFPSPIEVGDRAVGWVQSEISDWVQDRINASRTTAYWGKEMSAQKGGA
jgi:prophage regulatory protein